MVNGMGATPLMEPYIVFNEVESYLETRGSGIYRGRPAHDRPEGWRRGGLEDMVDALDPAVRVFRAQADSGASVAGALGAAVDAARSGAESTAGMVGRKGRAFHAGERGVGHQDPGATSAYLLLKSAYETAGRDWLVQAGAATGDDIQEGTEGET